VGGPTDDEFEEYTAYAVECRRRIKEQMNKRKPDDEFARVGLSYIRMNGEEIIVHCPESKNAPATQEPIRRRLTNLDEAIAPPAPSPTLALAESAPTAPPPATPQADRLTERHFIIQYDDTGQTYDSIFGPYLSGARTVTIEDPYIRAPHQIGNFLRFCETVVKVSTIRRIALKTGYDGKTDLAMVNERLSELKQSLLEYDVVLDIELSETIHDREIRIDNGWIVKIGRGLDFYQKPDGWFAVGANDLSLRKCLETKVDIYHEVR
jgi:ATP-dependent Lon protease